jgi:hypothetical protein
MARGKSFTGVVGDWKGLLEAVERNPDVQPSVEVERQALAQSLAEAEELKARQDELTARRQEVTQLLKASLEKGKDVAMRVRAITKGKVGPRNEKLVHFKVAPLRKRPRRLSKEAAVRQPASTSEKPVA